MFNNFIALLEYDGEDGLGLYPFDITSNKNYAKRITNVKHRCNIISSHNTIGNNICSAILLENGNIQVYIDNSDYYDIPIIQSSTFSINYLGILNHNENTIVIWGIDNDKVIHQWRFVKTWTYCNSNQQCFYHPVLADLDTQNKLFYDSHVWHQLVNAYKDNQYLITHNHFDMYQKTRLLYILDNNFKIQVHQIDRKYHMCDSNNCDKIELFCNEINKLDIDKLIPTNIKISTTNLYEGGFKFVILTDGSARILSDIKYKISIPNEYITYISSLCTGGAGNFYDRKHKYTLIISTTNGNLYSLTMNTFGCSLKYTNIKLKQIYYSEDNGKTLISAKVSCHYPKIKSARSYIISN